MLPYTSNFHCLNPVLRKEGDFSKMAVMGGDRNFSLEMGESQQ